LQRDAGYADMVVLSPDPFLLADDAMDALSSTRLELTMFHVRGEES
jgi:hypothetical protein